MSDIIRSKVAKILNSRELVISAGENKGVNEGMIFSILNPRGTDIIDPDTKENLGSIPAEKMRVKIIRVEEKLAVGRTCKLVWKEDSKVEKFKNLAALGLLHGNGDWVHETLKKPGHSDEYGKQDRGYVEVGDAVTQVLEGEDATDNQKQEVLSEEVARA